MVAVVSVSFGLYSGLSRLNLFLTLPAETLKQIGKPWLVVCKGAKLYF